MDNTHRTRSSAYRRMIRRRKRRRQIIINRIKFAAAAVVLLAAVMFLCVKGIGAIISKIGDNTTFDGGAVAYAAQTNAAVENLTKEAQTKPDITMPYPVKSPSYIEINSDKVRSEFVSLVDIDTHQILAGKGCNNVIYPASMTKVMTLIIAVENIKDMNDKFVMTAEIIDPLVQENASRAGFDPKEAVCATDLMYGLILPSGADAAEALAIMISGSSEEFVKLMNEKCRDIGLKSTHFTNTSGLHDANQYTTPTEMAMIMEYAMQNQTCAKILSTYQYTTQATEQHPEGIELTSTMFSRMYGDEAEGVQITAGKTGYTDEAGNCLVSYAVKQNKRYICVTAGGTNKWHSIFDDIEIYGNYLP